MSTARAASLGRDEGDEAAFVGDVQRIEAEELAGRRHLRRGPGRRLVERDGERGGLGDLDQPRWPGRRA